MPCQPLTRAARLDGIRPRATRTTPRPAPARAGNRHEAGRASRQGPGPGLAAQRDGGASRPRGGAAAVSWDAQYVLVRAIKHDPAVAALEAGIPDVGALVFASLGVALALHGKRAIRARVLNVACVGISLVMNALASAPGWRDLAIWIMPSAIYALASDTLIGVIRAWVIARERRTGEAIADDEATPMAMIGGLSSGCSAWPSPRRPPSPDSAAGRSTNARSPPAASSPRPAARTRPAATPNPEQTALPRLPAPAGQASRPACWKSPTERHDLAALPLRQVSGIANQIGAEVACPPAPRAGCSSLTSARSQNGHRPGRARHENCHRHHRRVRDPAHRGQMGVPAVHPYRRLPRHRVRHLRLRLRLRLHPGPATPPSPNFGCGGAARRVPAQRAGPPVHELVAAR